MLKYKYSPVAENELVNDQRQPSPDSSRTSSITSESLLINGDPEMLTSTRPLVSHSTPRNSCVLCRRALYQFEDLLLCRLCHGTYHWRCVKPETISYYGDNTHFICDRCNDSMTTTTTTTTTGSNNSSYRTGIKIKSPNASETDYRDFVHAPTKSNPIATKENGVVHTIQYFEKKQQESPVRIQSNGQRLSAGQVRQPQDNVNRASASLPHPLTNGRPRADSKGNPMFQANYQYTPLKEYAAMRTNETYSMPPKIDGDRPAPARYSSGTLYYVDPIRPTDSSLIDPQSASQRHYISTTNLNINENSSSRRSSFQPTHSNPYVNRLPDGDTTKTSSRQQLDRHSTLETDSGIAVSHANSTLTEQQPKIEKKLTDLIEQLGKQLESDAQKLNEKLEMKLQNLEKMINQQTYIIQRQDEVIERLKTKMVQIESERDQFRDRLNLQENDKQRSRPPSTLEPDVSFHRDQQQRSSDRKGSTSSSTTTEPSRNSSKKTPAPAPPSPPTVSSAVSQLIKSNPVNQPTSGSASSFTVAERLASTVPLQEPNAIATNRLDQIIHQNESGSTRTSGLYENTEHVEGTKGFKSRSSSSSSSSARPATKDVILPKDSTSLGKKNSMTHRSLDALARPTSEIDTQIKATSMDINPRPVDYEQSQGSIYFTPAEASHPASAYQNTCKGWLRKQNRDSLFKRVERYYCAIVDNQLLMYTRESDRKATKAINLTGSKVHLYDDQKYGPTIELTWSNRPKVTKHYHLYTLNRQEAEQWATAIQNAIRNLETRPVESTRFS